MKYTVRKNKSDLTIYFDSEKIVEQLKNYPIVDENDESLVPIYSKGNAGYLTVKDQQDEISDCIKRIEVITPDYLLNKSNTLKTKKNGKFRKGSVVTLFDVDIARYVTNFTNCWFHDRVSLRAVEEDVLVVTLEKTQTTH